jgi:hypothetical protein
MVVRRPDEAVEVELTRRHGPEFSPAPDRFFRSEEETPARV